MANGPLANLNRLILAGLIASLAACSGEPTGETSLNSTVPEVTSAVLSPTPSFGDLEEIQVRGTLRVAHQRWDGFDSLPTEGIHISEYEALAEAFAERQGLAVEWVEYEDFVDLLESADQGYADLVIGNITITTSRQESMAFTVPLSHTEEWLVGTNAEGELGVPVGTSYVQRARELGIEPVILPDWQADEVLAALADGQFDRTIVDAIAVRQELTQYPDINKLDALPAQPWGWVVRQESVALKTALDQFLVERHLAVSDSASDARDLAAIVDTGRLRMATFTGPQTYFLYKGELMGFEYELVKRFAKRHELLLEVVVADSVEGAQSYLEEGRADLVAAAVTATPDRAERGWQFTRPYMEIDEYLVTSPDVVLDDVKAAVDLVADGSLVVVANPLTSHWRHATELSQAARALDDSSEEILASVASGEGLATFVDGHLLQVHEALGAELGSSIKLENKASLSWVVRKDQPDLHEALSAFIKDEYRGLHYNLLRRKYFGNERRVRKREPQRVSGTELSPYDANLKELGLAHGFDWRLLVAQTYQESEFKPDRTSFAGARGLLQVMPRTAKQLGVDPDDLFEPVVGLQAGVRYLAWCRERFEATLPLSERTWFALAAYNAGPGHVRDARRLARELGLNPDLWFENVEAAMLKLADPEYARRAAHGYVRGSEPVNYVREIGERYEAYVDHLRLVEAG